MQAERIERKWVLVPTGSKTSGSASESQNQPCKGKGGGDMPDEQSSFWVVSS